MNEEELINKIKRFLNKEEDAYVTGEEIHTLLKLYEDKKEEAIAIGKSSYMVGVFDERNEWYKKINEEIKELETRKEYKPLDNRYTYKELIEFGIEELKELIGKEE